MSCHAPSPNSAPLLSVRPLVLPSFLCVLSLNSVSPPLSLSYDPHHIITSPHCGAFWGPWSKKGTPSPSRSARPRLSSLRPIHFITMCIPDALLGQGKRGVDREKERERERDERSVLLKVDYQILPNEQTSKEGSKWKCGLTSGKKEVA